MKICDIFEDIQDANKKIMDIIVMFAHNNNSSVTLKTINTELVKSGIQVEIDKIKEVAESNGFIVKDDLIVFGDDTGDSGGVTAPDIDTENFSTPAEQKAKEATRNALKKRR